MEHLKSKASYIMGFSGPTLPPWLSAMAETGALAGIILFDYSMENKNFDNNIQSPSQLKQLIAEIHALPGRPRVYVDQEGGKVRRLKDNRGFQPLVSHQQWAQWPKDKQKQHLQRSFHELKTLGVDVNLGPVVDINYNPESPDIGVYQRSFSDQVDIVRECAHLWFTTAQEFELELCLKHFPGLGRAEKNSHWDLTQLPELDVEQVELFYELLPATPGQHILLSHAVSPYFSDDEKTPISISKKAIAALRQRCPKARILTDDMQMQGLLKLWDLKTASEQALKNGVDLVCIGNNLQPGRWPL